MEEGTKGTGDKGGMEDGHRKKGNGRGDKGEGKQRRQEVETMEK